jgi:hypothetical protein
VLLQIRVSTPPARTDEVRALFENNAGTAHLAVLVGASVAPPGDLVLADVAREAADGLVAALRELRIDRDGGISLETVDATISRRAEEAERNAPGEGADAVIWEQVVRTTDSESSLSASYLAFLTIATLLAAIAIINDSAILTIGAMVLGPEFALSLALGGGEEFVRAATQLGINLAGILIAAIATLALQRAAWRRVPRIAPRVEQVGR